MCVLVEFRGNLGVQWSQQFARTEVNTSRRRRATVAHASIGTATVPTGSLSTMTPSLSCSLALRQRCWSLASFWVRLGPGYRIQTGDRKHDMRACEAAFNEARAATQNCAWDRMTALYCLLTTLSHPGVVHAGPWMTGSECLPLVAMLEEMQRSQRPFIPFSRSRKKSVKKPLDSVESWTPWHPHSLASGKVPSASPLELRGSWLSGMPKRAS